MKILVIHGPNLNLLGTRKPEIYGTETLDQVNQAIRSHAADKGARATCVQSNSEGKIIDFIHEHCHGNNRSHSALIINPGAYTHYSIAIRDAIEATEVPAVEVHLSDIHNREDFRQHSVIAPVCIKQISGRGLDGYLEAIDVVLDHLDPREIENLQVEVQAHHKSPW